MCFDESLIMESPAPCDAVISYEVLLHLVAFCALGDGLPWGKDLTCYQGKKHPAHRSAVYEALHDAKEFPEQRVSGSHRRRTCFGGCA